MFHFNKGHLADPTIPMWVVKTQGESFYVHHVESNMPWSTKETPDNEKTKGSIKFKECLLVIDENNCANLSPLTLFDKVRLRNKKLGITRIRFHSDRFEKHLEEAKIKHSPFKRMYGACGSKFAICDLLDKKQFPFLQIQFPNDFRVLVPNEEHYQAYDDKTLWEKLSRAFAEDDYGDYTDEDEDEDQTV